MNKKQPDVFMWKDFIPAVGVYFHFSRCDAWEQKNPAVRINKKRLPLLEQAQFLGYYGYQAGISVGGGYSLVKCIQNFV